jgi:hypothetical protein
MLFHEGLIPRAVFLFIPVPQTAADLVAVLMESLLKLQSASPERSSRKPISCDFLISRIPSSWASALSARAAAVWK